jgi:hypothetical protein
LRGDLLAKPYWLAPDAEAADVSLAALEAAVSLELLQAARATAPNRNATRRDFFTIRPFMVQGKQQRKVLPMCFARNSRQLPANVRERCPDMDACLVLLRITK